jgi:hypothetical protein
MCITLSWQPFLRCTARFCPDNLSGTTTAVTHIILNTHDSSRNIMRLVEQQSIGRRFVIVDKMQSAALTSRYNLMDTFLSFSLFLFLFFFKFAISLKVWLLFGK